MLNFTWILTMNWNPNLPAIFLIVVGIAVQVVSWHGIGNTDYHCWDENASAVNTIPIDCKGFDIRWISELDQTIKAQEQFSLTFELIVFDSFYVDNLAFFNGIGNITTHNIGFENDLTRYHAWISELDQTTKVQELIISDGFYVDNLAFFNGIGNISTSADAKNWCENTVCPTEAKSATKDNCCIWHVNIHSCPLAQTANGLCGPWIQPSGATFTHSDVLIGPINTGNWTSDVAGLYSLGVTSLIAHFKIARYQIALERKINVLPRTVCGDKKCETEEGEDCESCPKDCGKCPLKAWQIALIGAIGFLIVAAIVGVFFYFQYQKRKLLWDESWIIPYEDIRQDDGLKGGFGSMVGSQMDLTSVAASDGTGYSMATSAARRQMFAKTCMYDGRTCTMREIRKKEFVLTKQIRSEVRDVRECDHGNLCKFVGASVVAPHICILTEYCPKGSLSDVLLNDDVPINWAFRFSFAADISRGMQYLHSHKLYHGRLKSNNCVVDDRWCVKITDYGLYTFRKHDEMASNDDDVVAEDDDYFYQEKLAQVYKAPEFRILSGFCVKEKDYGLYTFRKHDEMASNDDDVVAEDDDYFYQEKRAQVYKAPEFRTVKTYVPTGPGDVYAFAIILIEIATRNDPYGDEDPLYVGSGWRPELPDLSTETAEENEELCPCPTAYIHLISNCWNNDPELRPTFDIVKKTIHKINPSRLSPVDLMMAMMEKYSKHLEVIVAERTQDLVAEKAKTDRLLYSMLPKSVADELRLGQPIQAQIHEACTIYFSDIVGFTTISGRSTPMEVVALLNKLYITFDEIIDKYDVYKVETIGDAYMVVSGIPSATPFHGREIADMALDLVDACRTFVIPHMEGEPLKIRVGLHSGSACAGVVGLKMPRYCLFGDTVNTASRMESNGEAYRIHISNYTFEELVKFGKYRLEKRGSIPIKGKGDMLTWWLNGVDQQFIKDTPIKCIDSNRNVNEISVLESKVKLDTESKHASNTTDKPTIIDIDDGTTTANVSDITTKQNRQNDALCAELKEAFEKQRKAEIEKEKKDFTEFQDSDYLFTPVEISGSGDCFKKLAYEFDKTGVVEVEPNAFKSNLDVLESYISSVDNSDLVNVFVNQMNDECKLERSDSHRAHLPLDRNKLDNVTNILDMTCTNNTNDLLKQNGNEHMDLL